MAGFSPHRATDCGGAPHRNLQLALLVSRFFLFASYPERDRQKNEGERHSRRVEQDQSLIPENHDSHETGQDEQHFYSQCDNEAAPNWRSVIARRHYIQYSISKTEPTPPRLCIS